MSLLTSILTWTKTLPKWQSDACRRLLQSEEGLVEGDYQRLYDLLKAEHGLPSSENIKSEPLTSSHLPTTIQAGETVILKEIDKLEHVNRIAPNQTLAFHEKGITVIYGGNGSGKSGYVRVMKQACRCRDQRETVHTNVNDPASASKRPNAKFKIERQGKEEVASWQRGATPPDILSTISIFDSHSARSYLTAEHDVAYLPYGLDIVENLSRNVIPKMRQRLVSEINSIDINTFAFNHLLGDTVVGKIISKLGPRTDPKSIEKLGTLSADEEKRITELNKALTEADPIAKSNDLKRFVSRLKNLAENILKIARWVDNEATEKLKALDNDALQAEVAEKSAAQVLQSGDTLLPGTGEQVWKSLFDAARKYSTEIACPEHEFPFTGEDAVCPLCQNSLDEEAGNRLERFEQYIKEDVAKKAVQKRNNLKEIATKIRSVNLTIAIDQELSDEISLYENVTIGAIAAFQVSIEEKRKWMLTALENRNWDNPKALSDNPRALVRKLAARMLSEARTFMKASDAERKEALTKEYNALVARQNLKDCLTGVLDLIERKKKVEALNKCNRDLKTKPISDKSKEFASNSVTKELKNALDAEFSKLGVSHIKTKLKERNDKGKILHQLLLELPSSEALNEILSEGEQRAIALGSFLAELTLSNHSCGIVFDDPVSSLDHWRRQHVARRLAEEAQKRQVIIFTHDTSFLGQLQDEIEVNNLGHKILHLEWKGNYSGNVRQGLPWGHSTYGERINSLEQESSRLAKKPWPQYPGETEVGEMLNAYSRLRATIERVIQDVVFCGVIRRYRDWISIGSLKDVVGFADVECTEINRLYQRCNTLVNAHDPSSAKNMTVPNPTELDKDLKDLKAVIETIKNRRKVKSIVVPEQVVVQNTDEAQPVS